MAKLTYIGCGEDDGCGSGSGAIGLRHVASHFCPLISAMSPGERRDWCCVVGGESGFVVSPVPVP